jgi:hypothetical protein
VTSVTAITVLTFITPIRRRVWCGCRSSRAFPRAAWDWRILFNGKGDEEMFGRGALATGGLSFAELKTLSLIKVAAKVADGHRIFRDIRIGLPGFENSKPSQNAATTPISSAFSN